MTDTRHSWLEQDQRMRQEAEALKQDILDEFWKIKILNAKTKYQGKLKAFLISNPPYELNQNQWSAILDGSLQWGEYKLGFDEILEKKFKTEFIRYFSHVHPLKILAIDEGERLNIANQKQLNLPEVQKKPIASTLTQQDVFLIKRYMLESKMSAAVSVASNNQVTTITSPENDNHSIFSIHSVGKIFTGMLVMLFLDKGILQESDLKSVIQIDPNLQLKLTLTHNNISNRLKEVTLLDVMNHQAGFKDYMPAYVDAINSDTNPNTEHIADFLTYASDIAGTKSYSNVGTLLVGLALEHAYNTYRIQHPEMKLEKQDFYGLVSTYIQEPAGMTDLYKSAPSDAKVNPSKHLIMPNESTPEAAYLVASPAGGYWTNIDDLRKFGEWLYKQCKHEGIETHIMALIKQYGQEFYQLKNNSIEHPGENPSASAMLSVSFDTGTVIATLSNSSRTHAHDLEAAIKRNIFVTTSQHKVKENLQPQQNPQGSTKISAQSLFSKNSASMINSQSDHDTNKNKKP